MSWQDDIYNDVMARRQAAKVKAPLAPSGQVIRQSNKGPNKTELRFEQERLKVWLAAGLIQKYEFEAVTLKLANGCKYTPDYWALSFDGRTQFYEIKARRMIWDDAIVKLKVATAKFDSYAFSLCAYEKGVWVIQEVLP